MITQKTLRGVRTPKSYILSGVRSSDGKRLDQDMNRNLGAELAKLSREKSELQQGLGGGNTMATYKLKRFSNTTQTKSYTLKRKTFGLLGTVGDVANNAINTGVGVAKNVGGTAVETTGNVVEKTAKVAKPIAGLGGGIAGAIPGAAAGAALGSIIPIVGTAIGAGAGALLGAKGGSALGRGAVDIVEGAGRSIKEGGQDLKGA